MTHGQGRQNCKGREEGFVLFEEVLLVIVGELASEFTRKVRNPILRLRERKFSQLVFSEREVTIVGVTIGGKRYFVKRMMRRTCFCCRRLFIQKKEKRKKG